MMRLMQILLMSLFAAGNAHGTFSIVAVDTVTREVGGAGASCISNCRIINDLHVGLGAIHTQALYIIGNQNYARDLMDAGVAPEDIIDSLVAHDLFDDPTVRQYGIVDLIDGGRSAGYTGENCTDWAGHLTGQTYAAQGNILLGPEIIDTMEYAFTHTEGELSSKLLAALQAAKVPGADTRCLGAGKSAISAFVRVMRIGDSQQNPYCNLNVSNTTGSTDPIDVLTDLYAEWLVLLATSSDPFLSDVTVARDTILANGADTTAIRIVPRNNQGQLIGPDVLLIGWTSSGASVSEAVYNPDSSYTMILTSQAQVMADTVTVYSMTGERQGELADHPIVHYIAESTVPMPPAPGSHELLNAYPNPFNAAAEIRFVLSAPMHVQLGVYDLGGRLVHDLIHAEAAAGEQLVRFDATGLPAGIYFVHLRTPRYSQTEKLLLLK